MISLNIVSPVDILLLNFYFIDADEIPRFFPFTKNHIFIARSEDTIFTSYFGLLGYKEEKELRWGDLVLKTDSDGKEYLEYFGRQTNTRTGEGLRNQRPIRPRMYAKNDAISSDRDPVHAYKMYKEKRPSSMLEPDSSFYLSVNYFKTESQASVGAKNGFKAQPLGVNKLNNITKDMTQVAGILAWAKQTTVVEKLKCKNCRTVEFLPTR